jgi:diguanylate cyclase (GGDEF)-like protein
MMNNPVTSRKATIQSKLVLIIVTISTLSLLLAATLFTLVQLQEHRSSLIESLTSTAKITAENVQAAILFSDESDANKILAEFSNDSRILTAAIYTSDKQLFASYDVSKENIAVLYKFAEENKSYQFENDLFHLYQPISIQGEGNIIGYVYLKANLDSVYQQLKQNILVITIIVFSVLILTILLTSKLQKLISAPILDLAQATKTIKNEKNYGLRVEHNDYLEIQQLSDGFNSMLSEIQERDNHLQHLAMYDELTGLHNRKYFIDILHQAIARGSRKSQQHAVLFLDLDRFKHVNDSLGHSVGDEILQQTSKRLTFITRDDDIVARFGGDEFIFLLQDIPSLHHVAEVTDRILEKLRAPFTYRNHSIVMTPSIGISLYPDNGKTPDDLLKKADTAMYRVKNQGGNAHLFFTDTMNQEAQHRQNLEEDLHAAIEKDEFFLHYQPKINLHSGEIVGMEALVRWHRKGMELVPPNAFIPIAEETGLIIPIGNKVIHKAIQQTKSWIDTDLFKHRVAINISAKQFRQASFLDHLKAKIEECQLSPEFLEFEITEAVVMENTNESIAKMKKIKDFGITLAMDDFGTGYSSLSYLKKFPFDILKIDMSFIRDMQVSNVNASIVRSIISLAHTLGLEVVAEGVEQENQATLLRDMNCDLIQGYLFSKPLKSNDISELLQKNTTLFDLTDAEKHH